MNRVDRRTGPANVDSLLRYLELMAEAGASPGPSWEDVLERAVSELGAAYESFDWTGIYLLEGRELLLGPFVGEPTEHVRIAVGQGLCGAAAAEEETIVVDDVHADSRYLACFAGTRSEIVVPIFAGGTSEGPVIGEIDVDSNMPAAFGHEERAVLERVAAALGRLAPPILAASQEPS